MGLFRNIHQQSAQAALDSCLQYLRKQDGNMHVLEINEVHIIQDIGGITVDEVYTDQINTIMDAMRNMGYIIIDVSTSVHPVIRGMNEGATHYFTEIKYK